jgi:hypothetical protein
MYPIESEEIMATDTIYEYAVIQDLQNSLERANEDKADLKELVDSLLHKVTYAQAVITSTNSYCQALQDGSEDLTGHMVAMVRAISEWNTKSSK